MKLGRGGLGLNPDKTAVLLIEVQNEFMSPGGKLHESVRPVMEQVRMMPNCSRLLHELGTSLRSVQLMFAPISFAPGGTDNPNRHLGILSGCDYDELFVRGSWGAELAPPMLEAAGEGAVFVRGKRGLSAFVGTDLEEQLARLGIETIALGGFMANCCVESTMRDAFDRGYNVVTLTDCVATTTERGYKSCVEITYPFFSTPMNCDSFLSCLKAATRLPESFCVHSMREQPLQLNQLSWAFRQFVEPAAAPMVDTSEITSGGAEADLYQVHTAKLRARVEPWFAQVGPWAVDVRQSAIGERIVLRSGEHEMKRYLAMGEATGAFGGSGYTEHGCDCIYADKLRQMQAAGERTELHEPFGWLCQMVVFRLPTGGCALYSPVLGPESDLESVAAGLEAHRLLPVEMVLVPSPQHHLAVAEFQRLWPDAFYVCGQASGQMLALNKKRRDLRFDGKLRPAAHVCEGVLEAGARDRQLDPPQLEPSEMPLATGQPEGRGYAQLLPLWGALAGGGAGAIFEVCIIDDNRTGEIVLLHKPSKTLVVSDLLYKSCREIVGPGGSSHHYSWPEWFAKGQEELFYDARCNMETSDPADSALKPLLPSYRTHPKARTIDIVGMRRSLETVLAWDFDRCLACHTDPIDGQEARVLIRQAWSWVWE